METANEKVTEMKVYVVLSLTQLRQMIKDLKADNEKLGMEIRPQSTAVFYSTVDMSNKYDSNGAKQLFSIMKTENSD